MRVCVEESANPGQVIELQAGAVKRIVPCDQVNWDRKTTSSIMEQATHYFSSQSFGEVSSLSFSKKVVKGKFVEGEPCITIGLFKKLPPNEVQDAGLQMIPTTLLLRLQGDQYVQLRTDVVEHGWLDNLAVIPNGSPVVNGVLIEGILGYVHQKNKTMAVSSAHVLTQHDNALQVSGHIPVTKYTLANRPNRAFDWIYNLYDFAWCEVPHIPEISIPSFGVVNPARDLITLAEQVVLYIAEYGLLHGTVVSIDAKGGFKTATEEFYMFCDGFDVQLSDHTVHAGLSGALIYAENDHTLLGMVKGKGTTGENTVYACRHPSPPINWG